MRSFSIIRYGTPHAYLGGQPHRQRERSLACFHSSVVVEQAAVSAPMQGKFPYYF